MLEKLLTVIIPAYNAQEFIRQCLESAVPCAEAELLDVIVVDDGSVDGTAAVARDYEARYPGVVRCISKENGGHGSAINIGSAQARGKYLKVLDADDRLLQGALEALLPKLAACGADIVLTPFVTEDYATGRRRAFNMNGAAIGRTYAMKEIEDGLPASAKWFTFHGIFFRTDYYLRLGLEISERISYDDAEYLVLGSACAGTVFIDGTYAYLYTVGMDGQSVSPANYARRERHLRCVMGKLAAFYMSEKGNPQVAKGFLRCRIAMLLGTCEKVLLLYCKDRGYGRAAIRALRRSLAGSDPRLLVGSGPRYLALLALNTLRVPAWLVEKGYGLMADMFGRIS